MRRGIQQTNIRNVWFIPHQYASGTGNYSLKVLHRLCLTGSKIGQTLFRDECEIQTPTFMFRSCPWLEEFWTGVPKGILTLAISGVVSEDLGAVLAFSTLLAQQLILLKFKKKKKKIHHHLINTGVENVMVLLKPRQRSTRKFISSGGLFCSILKLDKSNINVTILQRPVFFLALIYVSFFFWYKVCMCGTDVGWS